MQANKITLKHMVSASHWGSGAIERKRPRRISAKRNYLAGPRLPHT